MYADDIEFRDWKIMVFKYLSKIIKNIPNGFNDNELKKMFSNYYHPYVAAIVFVLKSDDFKRGRVIQSFVIPFSSKIIIYDIT